MKMSLILNRIQYTKASKIVLLVTATLCSAETFRKPELLTTTQRVNTICINDLI